MKYYSNSDHTQTVLIPYLGETENLLAQVASKLSGCEKSAEITAYPNLGVPNNFIRLAGGFCSGIRCTWDSSVPLIPIDSCMKGCGTAIAKVKGKISTDAFITRINSVLSKESGYVDDYTRDHNFISLVESTGDYGFKSGLYVIIHSNINGYKDSTNGLYPYPGVWYESDIKTEYSNDSSRYLRYISEDSAIKFYSIANHLSELSKERNHEFLKNLLGAFYSEEIQNLSHYGMPNEHTIYLNAHWENQMYVLLTAPGRPIFLIKPDMEKFDGSPHGFGLRLKIPYIESSANFITIGETQYKTGIKDFKFKSEVMNRCSNPHETIEKPVEMFLKNCPGNIVGKLHQICTVSKDGINIWKA